MKKLERLANIILVLTVVGLVITEYHFFMRDISGPEYVELISFLYGGGVFGKFIPVMASAWLDHKAGVSQS